MWQKSAENVFRYKAEKCCDTTHQEFWSRMLLLALAANDSPTLRAVGSHSPGWTLVAFLDSYSFPLSFSPPPSHLQPLAFFSLPPPLTFSFAPQLPSSPPSSCSLGPLMEQWVSQERRISPIQLPTSWTPTPPLQPPSDPLC